MSCESAMITEVITAKPDETVETVLARLSKHSLRCVPVIDDEGVLVGLFCLNKVLENLLPVAVTMPDGLQRLNFVVGAAPGIAKRLNKLISKNISEVMDEDMYVVHPTTQSWEAIRLMVRYGSPIPVVEKDTGKLCGLISEQSSILELDQVIRQLEKDGEI
ncbi:MAG: CBS domain-containing protein [Alphaproteobacteria bacterium]|nr:CBS domain-containing protein [Alphaproteobacteria bacterium]